MKFLKLNFIFALFLFFNSLNAVDLPDFSEIAEEQGKTVVNISVVNKGQTNQNISLSREEQQLQEFLSRCIHVISFL